MADIFESFGLTYLGPSDGHDLREMINVLSRAKELGKPALVHVLTKKQLILKLQKKNLKH